MDKLYINFYKIPKKKNYFNQNKKPYLLYNN